jgi:Concanavalin A-like lectin/glucanases superfamily
LGPLGTSAVSTVSGNWSGYCAIGTVNNITYNTTDVAAPDGSYTATRIVRDNVASCGANSNAWGILTPAAGVFTAGKTYTVSAWIMTTGPAITNMALGGNDYYSTNVTVTSVWQRFSRTFTPSGAVNTLDRGFQINTPATNVTYYVWGAQTEEGSTATPYQGWNPGTNIALGSQQFDNNTYWGKTNSSISAYVVLAPDGSLTGDKLVENSTLNEHSVSYYATQGANITETFSVYAKAGERYQIVLSFSNFVNADARVYFNLYTGTIFSTAYTKLDYSNVSGTITGVGNGWYRCSITATKAAYNTNNYPNILLYSNSATSTTYTGDGTSGVYLWGAQIELGSAMTAYRATTTVNLVPTTTTFLRENTSAVYTTDSLDEVTYNQASPAIVNLVQYSQELDNVSYWAYNGSSVIANAATAPDGTFTADKLVGADGITTRKSVYQYPTTFVAGQTYTLSVYLKTAGVTNATIWLDSPNISPSAYWGAGALINLIDGSVGGSSPQSTSTTAVGNGWYRCQVTGTFTVGGLQAIGIAMGSVNGGATEIGNGVDGIFVWGAQLEVGVAPSPYQPKTANAIVAPTFRRRITNNGPVYVTSTFDEWTGIPVVDSSLTMWLDFGQPASYPGSGVTVFDISRSQSANVTLSGTPTFDIIDGGGSEVFNGTTQYGTGAGTPLGLSAYTKSFWFKLTSYSTGNNVTSSDAGGHFSYFGGGTRLQNGHSAWTNFGAFTSVTTFNLNTWYHACVTFDTNTGMVLYVNGVLDSTYVSTTGTSRTNTPVVGTGRVDIAQYSGTNFLTGSIGQVMIYNRALTAAEAAQNFTALRNRYGI